MILCSQGKRLRIALQTDHARLSGDIAAAWGGNGFAAPEPLGPVRLAADLHDLGWYEYECEPRVRPETGRPYDFLSLPADLHTELYGRGIQSAILNHPYAGLLVSLHGAGLYKQRYGYMPQLTFKEVAPIYRATVDEYLAEQAVLQQELITDLRVDEQTLWTHYRWLQCWDLLSLFLCLGDPAGPTGFSLGVMPRCPGGPDEPIFVRDDGPGRFRLTPWPFAPDSLELMLPVRFVADNPYISDEEFQAAFRSAPTEPLVLTLTPGTN